MSFTVRLWRLSTSLRNFMRSLISMWKLWISSKLGLKNLDILKFCARIRGAFLRNCCFTLRYDDFLEEMFCPVRLNSTKSSIFVLPNTNRICLQYWIWFPFDGQVSISNIFYTEKKKNKRTNVSRLKDCTHFCKIMWKTYLI